MAVRHAKGNAMGRKVDGGGGEGGRGEGGKAGSSMGGKGGGLQHRATGGARRPAGAREGNDVRVLLSGEIRRRVAMWLCRCNYAHLPRNQRCRVCGCSQNNALNWEQQWWDEGRLPWDWRGANHPITLGTAKGVGGRDKGGRREVQGGGNRAPPSGPAIATRPKAQARPRKSGAVRAETSGGEGREDDSGWQQGGLSAKERKKAKRKAAENRSGTEKGDADMESNLGSDEQETTRRQRTRPIELPELPRVTLVRRLEARRAELDEEKQAGGNAVRIRRLERRIQELDQKIRLSGGHTNKRQSFAILDTEKAIAKTEGSLEDAERVVEQRQQALEEAKDECEEVRQRLANLRKRLAHITAQKAQESTEGQDAQAIRKAMDTMRRMAGDNISDEVNAVLSHLQRLFPVHDEEDAGDETLSSSKVESSNDTVPFMDEDWDGGSIEESDFEPERLAEIKDKRQRILELQQELKATIEGAAARNARDSKRARKNAEGEQEEGVPTLSADQATHLYRQRIREATAAADRAMLDARKEVVPQLIASGCSRTTGASRELGQGEVAPQMDKSGSNPGQAEAGCVGAKNGAGKSVVERWETAEQRDARKGKGGGGKEALSRHNGGSMAGHVHRRRDIDKARAELGRHTEALQAAVETNKQIQLQERLQLQQDLERTAVDVAHAHATGAETEREVAEQQIYWAEVLRATVEESSLNVVSPLVGTYARGREQGSGRGRGKGASRFKSLAVARTRRSPAHSTTSSSMEVEGNSEKRKRRKDRARKTVSRSPRGYRARSCER